eukprot:11747359-Prorocentrum_lima.AAC.1
MGAACRQAARENNASNQQAQAAGAAATAVRRQTVSSPFGGPTRELRRKRAPQAATAGLAAATRP